MRPKAFNINRNVIFSASRYILHIELIIEEASKTFSLARLIGESSKIAAHFGTVLMKFMWRIFTVF